MIVENSFDFDEDWDGAVFLSTSFFNKGVKESINSFETN